MKLLALKDIRRKKYFQLLFSGFGLSIRLSVQLFAASISPQPEQRGVRKLP